MPVSGAQGFTGTEKYHDAGIFLNCADDNSSQVYQETVSCFRHLTIDSNVCPDITESEFRSQESFNLYLLDVCYQSRFSAPQLVKLTFRVIAEIEGGSYASFVLVLKH